MHALHAHQKRPVHQPFRQRDEGVERGRQLVETAAGRVVGPAGTQRRQRGPAHHRRLGAGELVPVEEFADLHFHQIEQVGVVHHVGLVEEHHHARHADLAGQQQVFRVCGIGPSSAATTRMAPSIWAAPTTMFLM